MSESCDMFPMIWTKSIIRIECLCSPKIHVRVLTPNVIVLKVGPLGSDGVPRVEPLRQD
jgi:hypothetical protein